MIWNILATDADFGPDGALWVCDWVDGWVGEGKGRIYRFFNPSTRDQLIVREVQSILKEGFRGLDDQRLGTLLEHADRRVRSGAQLELASRGNSESFARLANNTTVGTIQRLHGVWGLAQVARLKPESRVANAALLTHLTSDKDVAIRTSSIAGLGDAGLKPGDNAAIAAAVVRLLADSEPRVRYAAAIAAGKLQIDQAFEPVLKLLADNADADPALRHAGIMALRGAPDSTRVVELSKHPSKSVRLAAVVALRKRQDPQVAAFLTDTDVSVQTEAARAINDVPQLHGALASLAALTTKANAPDALLHRALNANFRLGSAENAKAIAAVAADKSRSEAMRREALEMLRDWAKPGDLDRVMNRHLPLADREATPAREALAAVLENVAADSGDIGALAANVAAELGIQKATGFLEKLARDGKAGDKLRIDAIKSLTKLDKNSAAPIVKLLMKDESGPVRAAALKSLTKLDPASATPLLVEATQSKNMVERQSAWDTLADVDTPEATTAITEGLQQYIAGKLPADVWMNVIEASEGRVSQASLAAREAFEKAEAEKDPLALTAIVYPVAMRKPASRSF